MPAPSVAAVHRPFPHRAARRAPRAAGRGADESARAARAANALADAYADAIAAVLAAAGVAAGDVLAAGVHGQTVRHCPDEGWTAAAQQCGAGRRARRR